MPLLHHAARAAAEATARAAAEATAEAATSIAGSNLDVTVLCFACATSYTGEFCPHCGESAHGRDDLSLKHFIAHAFHDLTHFDSKIFRTLKRLVLKPGALTNDFLDGHRKKYVAPFQLFLVVNLLFFLLNTHYFLWYIEGYVYDNDTKGTLAMEQVHKMKLEPAVYEERFDSHLHSNQKAYIILLIPLFALLLKMLYVGERRYYVEHLGFASHFFAFLLLFLIASPILLGIPMGILLRLSLAFGVPLSLDGEIPTIVSVTLVYIAYLYVSARRVYGESILKTLSKASVAGIATVALFLAYKEFLFWLTYLSL